MTELERSHLTADDLDLLLLDGSSPAIASHLATCLECRQVAKLDAQVVGALRHLPQWEPGPEFIQLVMQRIQVRAPELQSVVPAVLTNRAVAARRRVVIGGSLATGVLAAGFAWAFANPAEAAALAGPTMRDVGQTLWLSLQGITANALEQPWLNGARDLLSTPSRAAPVLIAISGGYLALLLGLRRILTRPAAHAAQ
jgi:hypothetical protein